MKKLFVLLFSVLLFMGLTSAAGALTLSNVSGSWSNPDGGTNIDYTTDTISYGNGTENQIWWGTDVSNGQSGLGFTGRVTPFNPVIDAIFELGQLQHFNNAIARGTSASAVDLTIALFFSDPAGLEKDLLYNFVINETPNLTGDPYEDRDFIYFIDSYPAESFLLEGYNYTLQLMGFGDTADSLIDEFESNEGGTSTTLLWAKITTKKVPEPGTMLLLGTGLLGIAVLGRKKIIK